MTCFTTLAFPPTIPLPMMGLFSEPRSQAVFVLIAGSAGLLTAVLLLARTLFSELESAPTRRTIAHALPIGVTVVIASLLGQTHIAIALIFGSSVAALSAVVGFVTFAGPVQGAPPFSQRLWSFLPVPMVLVFVLGMQGRLGVFEAGVLLGQGILVALIWPLGRDDSVMDAGFAATPEQAPASSNVLATVLTIVALALLSAVAAWAAVRGAQRLHLADVRYPSAVMAATLLSVVLTMPMVSTGVPVAVAGRGWAAITSQIGVALINLCIFLPLAVLIPMLMKVIRAVGTTTQVSLDAITYPRVAWRIDAMALLILSLLYVPASDGRLRLGRGVAIGLIVLYSAYILGALIVGSRAG